MAIVYSHTRNDNSEVFYIGIGNSVKRAYSKHGRNKHWTRIVKKHGYTVSILYDYLSWNESCEKEKELIAFYGRSDMGNGTLCNHTDGGEGMVGLVFSDEYRQKISQAKMGLKRPNISGENHPLYGKHHSDETRQKMSESQKGRVISDEHRQRISVANLGKHGGVHRPHKKRNKHILIIEHKNQPKSRVPIDAIYLNGTYATTFDSLSDAAYWICPTTTKEIKVIRSRIHKCILKDQNTACGYKWKIHDYSNECASRELNNVNTVA